MAIEVQEVIPALPVEETVKVEIPKIQQREGYIEVVPGDGPWAKAANDIFDGDFTGLSWVIFFILFLIFLKPIIWFAKWIFIGFFILMAVKFYYA